MIDRVSDADTAALIEGLAALPTDWHEAGMLSMDVIRALARCPHPIRHSVETGTGRSTLLLSHMSSDHTVFTLGGDSILSRVKSSPLLSRDRVTFVEGPSQSTIPRHSFASPLDLVLIDGPHAYPFPELEYYCLYPLLTEGATLVVDDIHIPTIHRLYTFLREDDMFSLERVVDTTAFFRRTASPTFDPLGDGWSKQVFNSRRYPLWPPAMRATMIARRIVPGPLRRALKKMGSFLIVG